MLNKKIFKQRLLDDLYAPYKNCTLCPLGRMGRKNVVFGKGNPDANLLLIGEGPGKDEDLQGKPFVGRSGKLLKSALNALGIQEESIYITNVVKCRPPKNRAPLPSESLICTQLLLNKQIKIIQPNVICTLGASALKSLLGASRKITSLRGSILNYNSICLLPTFHPAYILRNKTKLPVFTQDLQIAYQKSNCQKEN